jgi:hypothetical protein
MFTNPSSVYGNNQYGIFKVARRAGKTTEIARLILIDLFNKKTPVYIGNSRHNFNELKNSLSRFVGDNIEMYFKNIICITKEGVENPNFRGRHYDSVYMDDCFIDFKKFNILRANNCFSFFTIDDPKAIDFIISNKTVNIPLKVIRYKSLLPLKGVYTQNIMGVHMLSPNQIKKEFTFEDDLPFWKLAGAEILEI